MFSFIAAEKTNYPVAVMCRVLDVNRTAFHNWERRAPSDRALTDAWLTEKIKQIHDASRGVYGAPRIHAELRLEHGIRVGRKRVARLMKAAAISGVRPRKRWRTTIRVPGVEPATDLVERDFRPDAPNVLWVADITYLRSGEGWLYLAAVQDTYSRQIVGWSMATHMRSTLVVDALGMALQRRRPGPGLIHHSDQGSQYVSLAFGRAAREAGIAVSMGSRGDAYDNAVAETFFATLKKELVNRRSWPSRLQLQSAVFEYIEAFYNRQRRHSTLGMLSPAEYEQTKPQPDPSRSNNQRPKQPVSSEPGQVQAAQPRFRVEAEAGAGPAVVARLAWTRRRRKANAGAHAPFGGESGTLTASIQAGRVAASRASIIAGSFAAPCGGRAPGPGRRRSGARRSPA